MLAKARSCRGRKLSPKKRVGYPLNSKSRKAFGKRRRQFVKEWSLSSAIWSATSFFRFHEKAWSGCRKGVGFCRRSDCLDAKACEKGFEAKTSRLF